MSVESGAPYRAFAFVVEVVGGETAGGFSEASGLAAASLVVDDRSGIEQGRRVPRVRGAPRATSVTLRRGVVSADLSGWIAETALGRLERRDLKVTLLDETRKPVRSWVLRGVLPVKYTGPALDGRGGGDVAVEELVLSVDGVTSEG